MQNKHSQPGYEINSFSVRNIIKTKKQLTRGKDLLDVIYELRPYKIPVF